MWYILSPPAASSDLEELLLHVFCRMPLTMIHFATICSIIFTGGHLHCFLLSLPKYTIHTDKHYLMYWHFSFFLRDRFPNMRVLGGRICMFLKLKTESQWLPRRPSQFTLTAEDEINLLCFLAVSRSDDNLKTYRTVDVLVNLFRVAHIHTLV